MPGTRTSARQRNATKASLVKVSDEEVVRHESLAYLDGYADARNWGEEGFFLNTSYPKDAREKYMMGFKKGLRVHRVMYK